MRREVDLSALLIVAIMHVPYKLRVGAAAWLGCHSSRAYRHGHELHAKELSCQLARVYGNARLYTYQQ